MLGIIVPSMIVSCSDDSDEGGSSSIDKANVNSNKPLGVQDALRLEVPKVRTGEGVRFVSHWAKMNDLSSRTVMNYCYEYDQSCMHTRWVAYSFDDTTNVRNVSRSDAWDIDRSLPSSWQLDINAYSYAKTGAHFDRGHICPSADRYYSYQANEQTFYMSNMSPQINSFNANYWAVLENIVRKWGQSSAFKKVYVCKGGTIREDQLLTSRNYLITTNIKGDAVKVAIPRYYFTAVLAEKADATFQAIAFIMEHKDFGYKDKSYPSAQIIQQHVVSVDALEEFTGIDFFCNVNDKLENAVESTYNINAWTWANYN